jgi:hypothetical protein
MVWLECEEKYTRIHISRTLKECLGHKNYTFEINF